MPRYGMFLNESEDADLIEILKDRNVSLFLKNMFREYLQLKKEKQLCEQIEKSEKEILFRLDRSMMNLERMIENNFLKLELPKNNSRQTEVVNEISVGEFENYEDCNIEV